MNVPDMLKETKIVVINEVVYCAVSMDNFNWLINEMGDLTDKIASIKEYVGKYHPDQ